MPVPELNVTIPDPTNITAIHQFWVEHTFGLFDTLLGFMALGSVFLKTRSISATLVAAATLVALGFANRGLYLIMSLLIAASMIMLWVRTR